MTGTSCNLEQILAVVSANYGCVMTGICQHRCNTLPTLYQERIVVAQNVSLHDLYTYLYILNIALNNTRTYTHPHTYTHTHTPKHTHTHTYTPEYTHTTCLSSLHWLDHLISQADLSLFIVIKVLT